MMAFDERLREALRFSRLKQADLAKRAGIAESQVSCYVNGQYMPNGRTMAKIARVVGVPPAWLAGELDLSLEDAVKLYREPLSPQAVPVVGKVAAGVPILAEQNVVGSAPVQDPPHGMFALVVKGDSMAPRIMDGDLVLVLPQETAEDGDVVVALVEDEATCKVFRKSAWGVTLVPFNAAYAPLVFSGDECSRLHIVGRVVESRHSWGWPQKR